MANALYQTEKYKTALLVHEYFEDFDREIDTTNYYTATLTDSGTAVVAPARNGILPLVPSDGTVTDNDEAYLGLRNVNFSMTAGKPINVRGFSQFAEGNTNTVNVAVGLTSDVAADLIVDNGAGMRATGTTFAIYKVDGETVWRCVSRVGATNFVNISTTTAGGAAYFTWEIDVVELLTTHAVVGFKIDGKYLVDSTTGFPIWHRIAYTGAAVVTPFVAIKNGAITAVETLNTDFILAAQVR